MGNSTFFLDISALPVKGVGQEHPIWSWPIFTIRWRLTQETGICKDSKKMSGKLKNSQILLSSGGIAPAKMNQWHWNANWNCNSLLQSNNPSVSAIPAKMAPQKSLENRKILKILWSSGGITPAEMNESHWNVNCVDLQRFTTKQ